MPFKTETTSAKSAWGQWASFSLGLGKLQGYKGRSPSLSKPFISTSKEETDWFNRAYQISAGLGKAYDAYEKDVSDDVDKYLNSHSLEEYQQHIKERGLPFQNDPVAMKVFKGKYAAIYSGLAETEFQERITDGDFKGLSEAELDAEHYKFMRSKLDEIYTDTDGEFSGKVFDDAFWSNSPKNRLSAMKIHQDREQKIKVQEDINANTALFQQGLEDGTIHDTDSALNAISVLYNSSGYHYTPNELEKQQDTLLDLIAQSENGVEILKGIRGKERIGLSGRTYDPSKIDTLVAKAVSAKATRSASNWYAFNQGVDELVKKDDLQTLEGMLSDSLKRSNDVETPESKVIFKAIEKLKANRFNAQKASAGEAAKAMATAEAYNRCEEYWRNAVSGTVLPAGHKATVGFTAEQFKNWFAVKYANGEISNDELVAVAGNTSVDTNNPAAHLISTYCTTGMNFINNLVSDTSAPIPSEDQIPSEVGFLTSIYMKDPNVFHQILSKRSGGADNTEIMGSILMARASGMSWNSLVDGMRDAKALAKSDSYKARSDFKNLEEQIDKVTSGGDDSYVKSYLLTTASHAMHHLGVSSGKALSDAKNQLESSHTSYRGSYVPNTFINSAGLNNIDGTLKLLDDDIASTIKKPIGTIRYNPRKDTIDVYGDNYYSLIKSYSRADLKSITDTWFKTSFKAEAEKRKQVKNLNRRLNTEVQEGGSD